MLVEEDIYSDYNQLLLKYFAAEGIACKQQIYVSSISSEEDSAVTWVRKLPFVSGSPPVVGAQTDPKPAPVADIEATPSGGDDMKIAFQYKKYMTAETMLSSKPVSWCHSFDLNKNMEASYISVCDISSTSHTTARKLPEIYRSIYDHLNRLIYANNESLAKGGAAIISRIVLPSLGSPFYGSHYAADEDHKKSLLTFLRALRGLLRQSLATCMISFPAHLYDNDLKFIQRVRHTADAVVQFSAFSGTFLVLLRVPCIKTYRYRILVLTHFLFFAFDPDSSVPVSPAFATFDGLFTVLKGPCIATLVPSMPAQPSFTFQFKRRKLVIEKIHLPPDMSVLEDKSTHDHHDHDHSHSHSAGEMLCAPGPSKASSLDF